MHHEILGQTMPGCPEVLRTDDVVAWLGAQTGARLELARSFLGAWVGVLHYEALERSERDASFLYGLERGEATLALDEGLTPEGWEGGRLWCQIAAETGLLHPEVSLLLRALSATLRQTPAGVAFEPVGRVVSEPENGFQVLLRDDFLEPVSEQPLHVLEPEVVELSRH